MAIGYVIRMGDRTSCGGQVLQGNPESIIDGMPLARQGDSVSCGVTGQIYQIIGGIEHYQDEGRLAAGNLDSFSSCPCQATLLPGDCDFTYESGVGGTAARWSESSTSTRNGDGPNALARPSATQAGDRTLSPGATAPSPHGDSEIAEPGFYIAPYSMSRSALEAALFDKPSLETLAMFRALNPGQGTIKGGSMIILSDPRNQTCTREQALLMEAAAIVNEALKPLSEEEADFMARHHGEISTFLAHTAAAVGVGEAMFSRNLNNVKRGMEDLQKLHIDAFERDRDHKLKSPAFLANAAGCLPTWTQASSR